MNAMAINAGMVISAVIAVLPIRDLNLINDLDILVQGVVFFVFPASSFGSCSLFTSRSKRSCDFKGEFKFKDHLR